MTPFSPLKKATSIPASRNSWKLNFRKRRRAVLRPCLGTNARRTLEIRTSYIILQDTIGYLYNPIYIFLLNPKAKSRDSEAIESRTTWDFFARQMASDYNLMLSLHNYCANMGHWGMHELFSSSSSSSFSSCSVWPQDSQHWDLRPNWLLSPASGKPHLYQHPTVTVNRFRSSKHVLISYHLLGASYWRCHNDEISTCLSTRLAACASTYRTKKTDEDYIPREITIGFRKQSQRISCRPVALSSKRTLARPTSWNNILGIVFYSMYVLAWTGSIIVDIELYIYTCILYLICVNLSLSHLRENQREASASVLSRSFKLSDLMLSFALHLDSQQQHSRHLSVPRTAWLSLWHLSS